MLQITESNPASPGPEILMSKQNLSALHHESKQSSLPSQDDEIKDPGESDLSSPRQNILMKHNAVSHRNSRAESYIQSNKHRLNVNFSPPSVLDQKNSTGRFKLSDTRDRHLTADGTQANLSLSLKESHDSSLQDHANPLISHKPILAKYANRSPLPNLKDIEQAINFALGINVVSPNTQAFCSRANSLSQAFQIQPDHYCLQVQNAISENFIPKGSPVPNKKLSKFTVKDTTHHVSHNLLPQHHTLSGGYQAIRNQIIDNISLRIVELIQVQSQARENTSLTKAQSPVVSASSSIQNLQTVPDTTALPSKIKIQAPILHKNYRQQKQGKFKNLQRLQTDEGIEKGTTMSKSVWKQREIDTSEVLSQESNRQKEPNSPIFSPPKSTDDSYTKDFSEGIRENIISQQSNTSPLQSPNYRQNHHKRMISEIQETSYLNQSLIENNHHHLSGILTKEVNKKNFTIFKTSTSGEELFVGTSQNVISSVPSQDQTHLNSMKSRLQFPLKSIKDFQSSQRVLKKQTIRAESPDKTFMTFLNHQNPATHVNLNTLSRKMSLSRKQSLSSKVSLDHIKTSLDSRATDNTSQDLQQRYKKKQVIYIFSEGENLTKDDCACYKFDLNALINRYYVYQEGSSKHKDPIEDPQIQKRLYIKALQELIEKVNDILRPQNPSSTLPNLNQNQFKRLYMMDGSEVKSLLDIPADCGCLVACCNLFIQINTNKLLDKSETVDDFAKRLIKLSNIQVDPNPGFNTVPFKPLDQLHIKKKPQVQPLGISLKQQLIQSLSCIAKTKQVSNSEVQLPRIQEKKPNLLKAISGPKQDHKRQSNLTNIESLKTIGEKEMKEAINERKTNEALAQRKHWKETYQLADFQLFELFSEFTSLMMIARQDKVEKHQDSVQAKFNKSNESRDYLASLLPFQSGCLKTYTRDKKAQIVRQFNMTKEDLTDFRVPLDVFTASSLVFLRTKPDLRLKILHALGIDIKNPSSKVDWESFLFLNKLLRYSKATNEEFVEFYCKFFDPQNNGIVTDLEFEALIELLFGSGDEPLPPSDQDTQDKKTKNESLTDNLRYICQQQGVYQEGGLIDFNQLRSAFRANHLDIDVFKQALK